MDARLSTGSGSVYALDPELQVMQASIETQDTRKANAREQIDAGAEAQKRHRKDAEEAQRRAREAAEESGFLGGVSKVLGSDVAMVAGGVAMGAAAVATGGAAVPAMVVAAGLMTASKYGADHGWDPKLCAGLGLAGAAAGLATGNAGALGSLAQVGQTTAATAEAIGGLASAAQGAAVVAGGATGIAAGIYDARAQEARADAKGADGRAEADGAKIDDGIESMKKAQRSQTRSVDLASQAQAERHDAMSQLAARAGGGR